VVLRHRYLRGEHARAANADNDYATALLIEKIAHSPYANSTLIFVIEDDPQDGADHVSAKPQHGFRGWSLCEAGRGGFHSLCDAEYAAYDRRGSRIAESEACMTRGFRP